MKLNISILYIAIVVIVILMLIFGWQKGGIEEETEVAEEVEESAGSGFLEIGTMPGDADIYVDRLYSGKSPITLYNVPAGSYNIIIKKEGYEDFIKEVSIEAGKKTFLEAMLILLPAIEEEVVTDITEGGVGVIGIIEEKEEETLTKDLKESGIVNIGEKILLYYDFSKGEFTNNRQPNSDVFSKRYKEHLIFTRFTPVNVKAIEKSIDKIEKEDCIGIKGSFEWLYSGQSLCVITKENQIAAIGGTWEETEDAELKWKVFS